MASTSSQGSRGGERGAGERIGGWQSPEELLVGPDSDREPTISVVMPTLNEERGVEICIGQIKEAMTQLQMRTEIIVSDSSTDRTPVIAKACGAIVVEPTEGGYGRAYKTGFGAARGEYIVMGDADATYDFSELPRLIEPVMEGDADIVLGSRFEGDIRPGAMPNLHQYVGNPLLTGFLNVFYDADVSDAHSGFRVFSRDALEEFDLQSDGMEFASEMVMDASTKGLTIQEVPITYHERVGDATLDSFRDGWRHVKFMLTNAPSMLFALPAVALVFGGVGLLVVSQFTGSYGGVFFGAHTAIIGSLLVLVGYEVGCLAVFSGVAGEPIREPEDPITRLVIDRFRLEHGASLGVLLFVGGVGVAGVTTIRWIASGYTVEPMIVHTMPMFTAIVLGFQTVFNSFFLSLLRQGARESTDW